MPAPADQCRRLLSDGSTCCLTQLRLSPDTTQTAEAASTRPLLSHNPLLCAPRTRHAGAPRSATSPAAASPPPRHATSGGTCRQQAAMAGTQPGSTRSHAGGKGGR
jgi:hypothetical protein